MPEFLSSISPVILVAVVCAAVWGVVCGIFERVLLAPRRRLSAFGPAYFPSMLFAFYGAVLAMFGPDGVRFRFALLMAALLFLLGAALSLATFYLSRWILRTRFQDEKDVT